MGWKGIYSAFAKRSLDFSDYTVWARNMKTVQIFKDFKEFISFQNEQPWKICRGLKNFKILFVIPEYILIFIKLFSILSLTMQTEYILMIAFNANKCQFWKKYTSYMALCYHYISRYLQFRRYGLLNIENIKILTKYLQWEYIFFLIRFHWRKSIWTYIFYFLMKMLASNFSNGIAMVEGCFIYASSFYLQSS